MQPSTILQCNDVLNFPLPPSLSEGHTRTTLSVPTKSLFPTGFFTQQERAWAVPHPSFAPFKRAGYCKAGISIKSQLRWRQMRYPSCNVQRKSSCKAQLLIRTRIKISLNKYKERVHEGKQPTGTGSHARVSLRCLSPRRSPRQTVPRAGQPRTRPAASCRCSYRRHLQTERAAASLWSGTSTVTRPPAGTVGEQHSRGLGTGFLYQP